LEKTKAKRKKSKPSKSQDSRYSPRRKGWWPARTSSSTSRCGFEALKAGRKDAAKSLYFFFEVGKRSGLKKGVGASWRQEASATTFLIPSFPLFRSPSLQPSTHRAPAELPPRSQKASVSLLSWKTPRRAILSKAEKEGCRRRLERSNRNLIRPSLSFTLGQLSRLLRARAREREAIRISAPVAAAAAFNEHTERTRQLAFQGERKKVKENQRSRKKKNQKITLKNHSVVISKNKKDTLCSFGCSPGVPSRIDPHDAALERLLRRRARKSER